MKKSLLNWKKVLLGGLVVVALTVAVSGFILTRDGELNTPSGDGEIALDAGNFEAFRLPNYAAKFVGDDYKSYLVEVAPDIKIHVLEVGSGYPVYMQHGVPTSGFLYRQVADQLPRDQFRVIMPTMVGFGFSSKVPASQHTLDSQIGWMNGLLNKLALDELIFVGHDWGGPVGMGALSRSSDLLKGAVILNTVLDAPKKERDLAAPLIVLKTPVVGEIIIEGLVSIFDQLPGLQNDPNSFPPALVELYERPVRDSGNAKAPLALTRMAVDGPDHPNAKYFREIENLIRSINFPSEIVWGINDSILAKRLSSIEELFPEAPVTKTEAGHYLQEETPQEIASAIERVFGKIQSASR